MRRSSYPAGAVHVLAHIAAFALAGYALAQILRGGRVVNFAAWFVGAAILHDLVVWPTYAALDRLAHRPRRTARARRVPVVNHIRVPAAISGLLLLVYFPLILGLSGQHYLAATGHHPQGYARNWLEITAALFACSAILYVIRLLRAKSS